MQNFYLETNTLDKRARELFGLDSEIMVENAANAMRELIFEKLHKNAVITIICGSGDNGADGYALARKISGAYSVRVFQASEPKSALCVKSCELARRIENLKFVTKLLPCDCVVDCLFGSGLRGEIPAQLAQILKIADKIAPLKIACDVPSGLSLSVQDCENSQNNSESSLQNAQKLEIASPFSKARNDEGRGAENDENGAREVLDSQKISESNSQSGANIFKAHYTICMGALKYALLTDLAKDFVGEIIVADLGVSRKNFEITTPYKLLEKSDLKLPTRDVQNSHKGDFGHLAVFSGEKSGASIIAGLSAINFGAGLVTLCATNFQNLNAPFELMSAKELPKNTSAIAAGMGLGENLAPKILTQIASLNVSAVIDADCFYHKEILQVLQPSLFPQNRQIVLTPHPKEFENLLKICGFGDVKLNFGNKLDWALKFCEKYASIVLLLKGANTIIAQNGRAWLNTLGNVSLAKGGSGDVLAGMIGALLAQGNDALESAINASLAHALAAQNITQNANNYSLTPQDLIQNIKKL